MMFDMTKTQSAMGRVLLENKRFSMDEIQGVQHTLASEPLLSLEKLTALAARMSAKLTRWHSADIPVGTDFSTAAKEHANGKSLLQTLETIDSAASWVYLQQIEKDPEYAGLVREVLGSLAPQISQPGQNMSDFHGWVFISSPGAVTPYHMDHETNFLLQIRGAKSVSVWDPRDRSVLAEEELEHFHGAWSLSRTQYRDSLSAKARVFEANPNTGVFMPFTAPHAVKNGPEVSITLSLTFLTDDNRRESAAFAANNRLRQMGMSPPPVGRHPWLDYAKGRGYGAWSEARQRVQSLRTRALGPTQHPR